VKWYINYCTNMFSVFTKLPCGRNCEISNRSIQNPYEQLPNICNQLTIRNALLYTAVTRNLSAKNRTQQCILKSITKNKVFYTVLNKFDYRFTTTTTTVPPFFAVLRSSVLCRSFVAVRCSFVAAAFCFQKKTTTAAAAASLVVGEMRWECVDR